MSGALLTKLTDSGAAGRGTAKDLTLKLCERVEVGIKELRAGVSVRQSRDEEVEVYEGEGI